jgi:hypothetical protein
MSFSFRSMYLLVGTMAIIATQAVPARANAFVHPGALHSEADFIRMKTKVAEGAQPWTEGWAVLIKNPHASLAWKPRPAGMVYRGADGVHPENYSAPFNDVAAAYALALRWKIGGDDSYADKAVAILDAWSGKLTGIGGTSDRFLASGIYGYQIANAAEILRGYRNWPVRNVERLKTMMLGVFYPINQEITMSS